MSYYRTEVTRLSVDHAVLGLDFLTVEKAPHSDEIHFRTTSFGKTDKRTERVFVMTLRDFTDMFTAIQKEAGGDHR